MKKVGILTFQNTMNYGAVFQSYALQKKISSLGYDVETIRYFCKAIEDREKKPTLKDKKTLKGKIKYLLIERFYARKSNNFMHFKNNYMQFSDNVYDANNIKVLNDKYDTFIVGSDQVWNYNLTGDDDTFLLNFVKDNKKKNSYAASLALTGIDSKKQKKYAKALNSFNHISVREIQGKIALQQFVNKDIVVDLDPVFLLTQEEWVKNLQLKKNNTDDYILFYQMNASTNLYNYARKLAKKEHLKIINVMPEFDKKTFIGSHLQLDLNPRDFLEKFINAKYIITNSFHGVALSIVFNKEFFTEIPNSQTSSRIVNILEIFGLENRNILKKIKKIDYVKVNKKIAQLRKQSIDNLTKSLGDKK